MNIIRRDRIRDAFERALRLDPDAAAAIDAVSAALLLDPEVVRAAIKAAPEEASS